MTSHLLFLLVLPLVARCLGQKNPCEDISLEGEDCTAPANPATGILIIGGHTGGHAPHPESVEFWSAADPEEGSCVLDDYPRALMHGPTANFVSGRLVACFYNACEIYQEGSWLHLQNITDYRTRHSSASKEDAVLLIGGKFSNSTEWIPVDGSPAQPGPFTVRHGKDHCTIQVSADTIVLTGGLETEAFVTEYHLDEGDSTALTPLGQPRWEHACGVYQDAGGQQVLLVTGGGTGVDDQGVFFASTEVAFYNGGGSHLEWREVEGGQLPSPRRGLKAAVIDNIIFITGGRDSNHNILLTSILSWDPVTEIWQHPDAAYLVVTRYWHAAVAIPSSIIPDCSNVIL